MHIHVLCAPVQYSADGSALRGEEQKDAWEEKE